MANTHWQSYEQVAVFLLDHIAKELGLDRVEGKQSLSGSRSDTTWEIDRKGFRADNNEGFVIIECRRYTRSRQNQEQMGALAYRIFDTGASGGIIVSPLGLQEGAKKVAEAEGIQTVHLEENSTQSKYILRFLNKTFVGVEDAASLEEASEIKVIKEGPTKET